VAALLKADCCKETFFLTINNVCRNFEVEIIQKKVYIPAANALGMIHFNTTFALLAAIATLSMKKAVIHTTALAILFYQKTFSKNVIR
jgi:hypothetical protein